MPEDKQPAAASIMPPPYWNPPQFDKAELLMIREVFCRTNFPGHTCAAIGRFLEKCEKNIANAKDDPYPMPGPLYEQQDIPKGNDKK